MADANFLYRHPRYYDIVFRRSVAPEIDFLVDLFRTHVGRPLRSLIELGCGPGYHARAFALRGYAASGLDRSEEMIRFARQEAEREGAAVEWIVGDMRDFQLPTPVDLACCLFDSIDGLHSIDDFVRHFQAVAGSLVSDGIYVIGQSHQRDTSLIAYGPFHYEGQRDGCKVVLDWATDVRTHTLSQTADVEIVIRVEDHGAHIEQRDRTVESFATPALPRRGRTPLGGHGAIRVVRGLPPRPALRRLARLDQLHHGIS